MADAPPPVPVAEAPPGDLFNTYDPGLPTDMFAPGYIKGYAPAEKAVAEWNAANRAMTRGQVEQTRMPGLYEGANILGEGGSYGRQGFGDSRGVVDPLALLASAQGGPYDMNARRDAIAARLAENARRQAPPAIAAPNGDGSALAAPGFDPMMMYKWPYAGGPPGGD